MVSKILLAICILVIVDLGMVSTTEGSPVEAKLVCEPKCVERILVKGKLKCNPGWERKENAQLERCTVKITDDGYNIDCCHTEGITKVGHWDCVELQ